MDYTKDDIGKLPELDGAIRHIKFLKEIQPIHDEIRHRKKTIFRMLGAEKARMELERTKPVDDLYEDLYADNKHDLDWHLDRLADLWLYPNFSPEYKLAVRTGELKYVKSLMKDFS